MSWNPKETLHLDLTDEDIQNGEIIFEVWNANILKNLLVGSTKHKVSAIDKSGKEEMLQLNLHDEGKTTGQGEVHCCISFTSPVNQPTPPAPEPNKSNVPIDTNKVGGQDTGKGQALSSTPLSTLIDSRAPAVGDVNKVMPSAQEEAKLEKTKEDKVITSTATYTLTPNSPALPAKEANVKGSSEGVVENGNETSAENQAPPPEGSGKASSSAAAQAVDVKGTVGALDRNSKNEPSPQDKNPSQEPGVQLSQKKPNDAFAATKEVHLSGENKEAVSISKNENHAEVLSMTQPDDRKGAAGKATSSDVQGGSTALKTNLSLPVREKRPLMIKITSIEAKDMPETESGLTSLWDKQDPYVKLSVGQEHRETLTVRKITCLRNALVDIFTISTSSFHEEELILVLDSAKMK